MKSDIQDNTKESKKGAYLGTEIDEKWWKGYSKDGLLARGNGKYGFEDDCFFFLDTLQKSLLKYRLKALEN